MELTSEPIKEFCAVEHTLLLGDAELSSVKSEVKVELPLKKLKKRRQDTLDTLHISTTPAKRRRVNRVMQ